MGVIDGPFSVDGLVAIPFHMLHDADLRQILEWRNDDRVRRWMATSDVIPWTVHRDFCRRLREADDRVYLRVDEEGRSPIGVIYLTDIDTVSGAAELGLYRAPNAGSTGVGDKLMRTIHAVARSIGVRRLSLRVQDENSRAIKLYQKHDYRERKHDGRELIMEKELYA